MFSISHPSLRFTGLLAIGLACLVMTPQAKAAYKKDPDTGKPKICELKCDMKETAEKTKEACEKKAKEEICSAVCYKVALILGDGIVEFFECPPPNLPKAFSLDDIL